MAHANADSAQHSASEGAALGTYSLENDAEREAAAIWAQYASVLQEFESRLEFEAAVYELGRFCTGSSRGVHHNDSVLVNDTTTRNDSPILAAVLPASMPSNLYVLNTIKERVAAKVYLPVP